MYIFAAQNFRECAGTSTKKNYAYAEKADVYNNVIYYGSAFVKANGPGVPVEIVSIRGFWPWTGGGESNL